MKTLIIEDEAVAAQGLRRQLQAEAPDVEILDVLQSVEETVEWFERHDEPDLVFMDIHLADGLAFSIFQHVTIRCPIVFTTAYDQYALKAFEVNSIDYLLKPIDSEHLRRALDKFRSRTGGESVGVLNESVLASLREALQLKERQYKSYFLVPAGDRLVPIPVKDIACIYIDTKLTHIISFDGSSRVVDKPLDVIQQQLDPRRFFRANRQYIVSHEAVKEIKYWMVGKLLLELSVPTPERIVVSRARTPEFKEWYTR